MIMSLAIVAALIGVVLGLRFKVFVLAPAIVSASAVILVNGLVLGSSYWSILLAALLTVTALQAGYFAGSAIRFLAKRASARQDPSGTFAVVERSSRRSPQA